MPVLRHILIAFGVSLAMLVTPPAEAIVQSVTGASEEIELEVHRGTLVRLAQPAAAVFVVHETALAFEHVAIRQG